MLWISEWFEFDERDKNREPFESRYTKDSYYTYIEAYDNMVIIIKN